MPADPSHGDDCDAAVSRQRWRADVLVALRAMPTIQRAVLESAYFAGLSQSQIAGRLHLTPALVRSLMATGLQELAHTLLGSDGGRRPHVRP